VTIRQYSETEAEAKAPGFEAEAEAEAVAFETEAKTEAVDPKTEAEAAIQQYVNKSHMCTVRSTRK